MIISIKIDPDRCQGSSCGACACICPTNVFTIENELIDIKSPDYCKLCGKCMETCPYAAISVEK